MDYVSWAMSEFSPFFYFYLLIYMYRNNDDNYKLPCTTSGLPASPPLIGLITSAGDPQVERRYLVKNTRRSCTCGSRSDYSHGSSQIQVLILDFLKVYADTCQLVKIRIKTGLILPVVCSPLQYLQIKPKNVLIGQELTKI